MFILNKLKHYIVCPNYLDKLSYILIYRYPYHVPHYQYIINTLFSCSYMIYNCKNNQIKIYINKGSIEWLIIITRYQNTNFNISTYEFINKKSKMLMNSQNIKYRSEKNKHVKRIYTKCKYMYESKIKKRYHANH